jgi:hypothetical protein
MRQDRTEFVKLSERRRHALGLALGLLITALGVGTTAGSSSKVSADAWFGFGIAFAVSFATAALVRYADFRRERGVSRDLPAAARGVGVVLGVAVGSVVAHALGASGRLVVVAVCGGFLVGAAILYWIVPTSADRR